MQRDWPTALRAGPQAPRTCVRNRKVQCVRLRRPGGTRLSRTIDGLSVGEHRATRYDTLMPVLEAIAQFAVAVAANALGGIVGTLVLGYRKRVSLEKEVSEVIQQSKHSLSPVEVTRVRQTAVDEAKRFAAKTPGLIVRDGEVRLARTPLGSLVDRVVPIQKLQPQRTRQRDIDQKLSALKAVVDQRRMELGVEEAGQGRDWREALLSRIEARRVAAGE